MTVLVGLKKKSWHQVEESDAWCQKVISRLTPPDEYVFSFYTVLLSTFKSENSM